MIRQQGAAACFTAATTGPVTLSTGSAVLHWSLQVLHWAGLHPMEVAVPLTAAMVLLVAWSFRREAARQRAINAADREWSATGRPVRGWPSGWAWSGWTPEPAEDDTVQVVAEPAAAVCQSCHLQPATVTVTYTDGPTFAVCSACSPVATVVGRAS